MLDAPLQLGELVGLPALGVDPARERPLSDDPALEEDLRAPGHRAGRENPLGDGHQRRFGGILVPRSPHEGLAGDADETRCVCHTWRLGLTG